MSATRTGAVLSPRALNRAALARQLLLDRADLPVPTAVRHLAGLNAQEPNIPYLGLWSRLRGFRQPDLTDRLADRTVVRTIAFRGTQHLIGADDTLWLRPVLQPLLARIQRNTFGRRTTGVNLDELVETAREHLTGQTLTRPELGRLLEERWPGLDRTALAWSVQFLEPILHPTPSGTWNTRGSTPFQLATDVLGTLDAEPAPDRLVRCHLAAFGPASVSDIRTWSGVSGLREVVASMGAELVSFTDENGRQLVDLPDASRPDPATPAPVRFLPPFDNLMLAYADRTRLMSDDDRRRVCVDDYIPATLLLDGKVGGTWTIDLFADTARLTVQPFRPLTSNDRTAVADEGARLLEFAAPGDETHEFRILQLPS